MKIVMVILDGLGDEPIAALGGRTPLETALIPNIHYVATRGSIGGLKTTFPGFPIESMVCIMGLIGYEPKKFYPSGRASFEALAKGIPLGPDDLVLRCNSVTVDRDRRVLTDFTGGSITDSDARCLISQMQMPHESWELYPGQSYRNILILRKAGVDPAQLGCAEPHMNIGREIDAMLPRPRSAQLERVARELGAFLCDSVGQIERMHLPETCKANMLWVWSPSRRPQWPSFRERTGLKGAFVGGLDFLNGIAMAAGIHYEIVPGATGYIDTNYEAKTTFALRHLVTHDFVLVHINAPDEEAHLHNYRGKIAAIEKADHFVVGPLLRDLTTNYGDAFRLIVCGDHTTRCSDGKHTDGIVPYAMYGTGVPASNAPLFSESCCSKLEPTVSTDFLEKVCRS